MIIISVENSCAASDFLGVV